MARKHNPARPGETLREDLLTALGSHVIEDDDRLRAPRDRVCSRPALPSRPKWHCARLEGWSGVENVCSTPKLTHRLLPVDSAVRTQAQFLLKRFPDVAIVLFGMAGGSQLEVVHGPADFLVSVLP